MENHKDTTFYTPKNAALASGSRIALDNIGENVTLVGKPSCLENVGRGVFILIKAG